MPIKLLANFFRWKMPLSCCLGLRYRANNNILLKINLFRKCNKQNGQVKIDKINGHSCLYGIQPYDIVQVLLRNFYQKLNFPNKVPLPLNMAMELVIVLDNYLLVIKIGFSFF